MNIHASKSGLFLAAAGIAALSAFGNRSGAADPSGNSTAAPVGAKLAEIRREVEGLVNHPDVTGHAEVKRKLSELAAELRNLEPKEASPKSERPAPEPIRRASAEEPIRPGHPFAPAIERAKKSFAQLQSIKDYSALMTKRERVAGKLLDYQYMYAKIRHEPLSVYLRFLGPPDLRGREVIYVAGRNNGNILAHEPADKKGVMGIVGNLVGTHGVSPTGTLAMMMNRYPITEIGMLNLTKRLVEVGEQDMRHQEADAKYYGHARVNDRECDAWVFTHPVRRDYFRFHRAEVFIDKELNLPIRYAGYDWPAKEGDSPVLLEEYTYSKIKLDNGFTDLDFDVKNPQYEFPNK
jgi:hypothetical protein